MNNNISQVSVNILPLVLTNIPFYVTVILGTDSSFNQAVIQNADLLYGNANITISGGSAFFVAQDNQPLAIAVTSLFGGVSYFDILYTKAVNIQQNPNNFRSLIQKLPLGIFTDTTTDALIGQIFKAKSQMLDDYYKQYFYVQGQVYADVYSPQLEYEYNQTVGLLQNSYDTIALFHLLSSMNIVALNTYDLELFISKYIYYRIGATCAVYINDHVVAPSGFWILGLNGHTELGITTILAGDNDTPVILDLAWTIFNSAATGFNLAFQKEITDLIARISRVDIGNTITFNTSVNPVSAGGFTAVGYTYVNDPRMLYGKCLAYLGDANYPLNIYGYIAIF